MLNSLGVTLKWVVDGRDCLRMAAVKIKVCGRFDTLEIIMTVPKILLGLF